MENYIKAVLFDLNETLIYQIRTERSHIASTYAALAKHYWDVSFESFESAWMKVHSEYAEKIREGRQLVRVDDFAAAREKLHEPW